MRNVIVALLLLAGLVSIAGAEDKGAWIADPSMVPLPEGSGLSVERFRMIADFDGDGVKDLALSGSTSDFGNAGGAFILYLGNAEGKYRKIGELETSPGGVAIEKIRDYTRVWTYWRGGGWVGELSCREIKKGVMQKMQTVTIHPGDSGTEMGRAILDAVFKNSEEPVRTEISRTRDGVVTWHLDRIPAE
jgi:hypothetical protein